MTHPPISLDTELIAARRALVSGDPPHAAFHVAAALTFNPANPDALQLFDEIIAASDAPAELIELADNPYYGEVAARAYILANRGELDQAFGLLAQVVRGFPNLGYEIWAERWLASDDGDSIDPMNVARLLAALLQQTVGRMWLRHSEVRFLERFVPLARAACATRTGREVPMLLTMASGLSRRVRDYSDAACLAERAFDLEPHAIHAVAAALAHRGAGNRRFAERWFYHAQDLDDDPIYWLEIARARWDADDLEGALLAVVEHASLTPKGHDPEAHVMLEYLRFITHNEEQGRILGEWLGPEARPDDVVQLVRPGGRLLPLNEATINAVRNAAEQMDLHGVDFRFGVSCIEAPSVRLAVAQATGKETPADVDYSYDQIPVPDPRRAVRDVSWRVWDYNWPDGTHPVVTVQPPGQKVRNAVAELAATRYFAPRWWTLAGRIAEHLTADDLPALLGAMVHPSLPPRGVSAWDWLRYVQIAGAFIIGRLDEGWQGSLRRAALLDLADGPMDWVVDAALCALTEVALDEPAALEEIGAYFERFHGRLPDDGYWSCRELVTQSYLRLPGRPAHVRAHFEEVLEELYAEDEDEDEEG